jgi:hypothetical protein
MDPYVEWPPVWPDFHDSLITCIRGLLQPLLRPKYAALTQDRLYIIESERARYPDVAVVAASGKHTRAAAGVLEAQADEPAIFELVQEEVRQPLIHIVETSAGNRLVTAIEVLSPDNKQTGEGRTSYLEKREEYRRGGANLVEIDLLRAGQPTVRVSKEKLASLSPWRYLVAVTRIRPSQEEVYHVQLAHRLPRVRVPLSNGDPDVVLDLQAAFDRAWNEGPYPDLLNYDGPPPGPISDEEAQWCRERIAAAGFVDRA